VSEAGARSRNPEAFCARDLLWSQVSVRKARTRTWATSLYNSAIQLGKEEGMSASIAKLLFICLLTAPSAICQSKQGQQMKNTVEQSKEFPDLKCRADAQRWTADPFDYADPKNLSGSRAIMVNGQFRLIPITTAHVTIRGLLERVREMDACTRQDADFEKAVRNILRDGRSVQRRALLSLYVVRDKASPRRAIREGGC
jgi:hypothetical protein